MKCPKCKTDLPEREWLQGCPVCKALGIAEDEEDQPSNEVQADHATELVENLYDQQSRGNNSLLVELKKQTEQLTAIKTILFWVLVIIPVSLLILGIALGAIKQIAK
ncbi:MAG TPA: hypothetical protein VFE46_05650 [Pirellulales bacterium]|jgi:uncharacterized Zn finger protein (UPF0148 family)|nr:hypothetical protein [Pirellulales bacterium]